MVSWGHAPRWPHLQLPQPATAEAPGSLLQADPELPEAGCV